ncbi:MAG: hypothetical protein ABW185_27285 [Sedimenticola sp.]
MDALKVLREYREDECPSLGKTKSGVSLSTLSKDELLHEGEGIGMDVLEICRLGSIDPSREEIAKLVHFGIQLGPEVVVAKKRTLSADKEAVDSKKKKTVGLILHYWCSFGVLNCTCVSYKNVMYVE